MFLEMDRKKKAAGEPRRQAEASPAQQTPALGLRAAATD
jgi:hypothetical protein